METRWFGLDMEPQPYFIEQQSLPCRALKPWSGTLEDPVTNWRSLALISSLYDSTMSQNHWTTGVSAVQCCKEHKVRNKLETILKWLEKKFPITFNRVLVCQSTVSILQMPPIRSSSSRSSNGRSKLAGMSSWKPFCNERNCCSIPRMKRYDTYNLEKESSLRIQTYFTQKRRPYLTYSRLFSSVTGKFLPSALRSCTWMAP